MKTTLRVAICALCLAFTACGGAKYLAQKPKLDFQTIDIEGLSLTSATLLARFEMENPNNFDVKLDRMDYTLRLNNKQMATGGIQEGFEIKKKSKKSIDIPVKIKYSDLIQFVKDLAKNKKTDYLLSGTVKSGPFEFPFEEKGDFELPIPADSAEATSSPISGSPSQ